MTHDDNKDYGIRFSLNTELQDLRNEVAYKDLAISQRLAYLEQDRDILSARLNSHQEQISTLTEIVTEDAPPGSSALPEVQDLKETIERLQDEAEMLDHAASNRIVALHLENQDLKASAHVQAETIQRLRVLNEDLKNEGFRLQKENDDLRSLRIIEGERIRLLYGETFLEVDKVARIENRVGQRRKGNSVDCLLRRQGDPGGRRKDDSALTQYPS